MLSDGFAVRAVEFGLEARFRRDLVRLFVDGLRAVGASGRGPVGDPDPTRVGGTRSLRRQAEWGPDPCEWNGKEVGVLTIHGEEVTGIRLGQLRAALKVELEAAGRPLPAADDDLDVLLQAKFDGLTGPPAALMPTGEVVAASAVADGIAHVQRLVDRVLTAGVAIAAQQGESQVL